MFVHTSAVRSITPHEPLEDKDEEHTVPLRCTIVTETDMIPRTDTARAKAILS